MRQTITLTTLLFLVSFSDNVRMDAAFAAECEARGCKIYGIQLGTGSMGVRGWLASEPLLKHSSLLAVPRAVMMTDADARAREPIVRSLANGPLSQRPELQLVVFLVVERARIDMARIGECLVDELNDQQDVVVNEGPSSRGQPLAAFYNACPASYAEVPLNWSDDEIDQLLPCALVASLHESRAELHELRCMLRSVAPRILNAAETSWTKCQRSGDPVSWAFQTVRSRSFHVDICGRPSVSLVPLADMINHSAGAAVNVDWAFEESEDGGAFVLRSRQTIKQGAELFCSYGRKTNSELLMQ